MKRSIKKAIAFIVALALVIPLFSTPETQAMAAATDFQSNDWNVYDYTGTAKKDTLPFSNDEITSVYISKYGETTTLEELTVEEGYTSISLSYFSSLKKVTLPASTDSIYLANCDELTEITIPEHCYNVSICDCPKLTKINFEKTNWEEGQTYSYFSVMNCGITDIAIPAGYYSVSLSECDKLQNVTLSEGTNSIYLNTLPAFKSLNLPNSAEYISTDSVSLDGIKSSKKLTVENGGIYQGDTLIAIDTTKDTINVKDGTRNIGYLMLSSSAVTTTINLPESVEYIKDFAFSGAENLKNVTIPKNVVTIGEYAFSDTAIKKLVIPAGTGYVYDAAFSGYNGIVTVDPDNESIFEYEKGLYKTFSWEYGYDVCLFFYPSSEKSIKFYPYTTSIGSSAFINSSLKKLAVPEGVINFYSYLYNSSIESLTLPASLQYIDVSVITSSSTLKKLAVNPINEYYSSYKNCLYDAGYECLRAVPGGLSNVEVYDGCLSASYYAFCLNNYFYDDYYSGIRSDYTTITIPKSVLTMGEIHCDKAYVNVDSVAAAVIYEYNENEKNWAAEWGYDPESSLQDYEFIDSEKDILNSIYVIESLTLNKGKKAVAECYLPYGLNAVQKLTKGKNTEVKAVFKSSNKKVAKVNAKTGLVTGVKKGTCTINVTFTIKNGKVTKTRKAKIKVKVK